MIKVYLDVGHGGAEQSMVANGLAEKDVNLAVATGVRRILIAEGIDCMMSRDTDTGDISSAVNINNSVAKSNAWQPDAAYSIHHNGFNGVVTGYDIIYSDFKPPTLAMANAVGEEFNALGRKKHGITTRVENGSDYYGIMREMKAPCIIIEFAYMDTPSEAMLIDTLPEQYAEAMAIARGILKFFGLPMPTSNVLDPKPVVIPTPEPVPPVTPKMTLSEALTVLMKKGLLPEIEAALVKIAQALK